MTIEGFIEYKRREFCKDVKCPVQLELNSLAEASPAYEQTRRKCSSGCLYTTWQFHHWLKEKGYVILISSKLKDAERTVLVNLDKELVEWADQQIQKGESIDKNQLIASAIAQYKKAHESKLQNKS
jgi:hypothetical protein